MLNKKIGVKDTIIVVSIIVALLSMVICGAVVVKQNNSTNYNDECLEIIDLYEYNYYFIYDFYKNEEKAKEIWSEINFCKEMKELREPLYLQVNDYVKKLKKTSA